MRLNRWARVTGKDRRTRTPKQQARSLGRTGDYTIVSPYGLYADLPAETLLIELAPGVAVPVTVARPSDTEQGEPVFFHPATNTRIIARNNGDLDVLVTEGSVNVTAANATIDAPLTTLTGDVQIDGALNVGGDITSLANVIASLILQGATLSVSGAGSIGGQDFISHAHTQGNDSDGDTQVNTGGVM